MQWIRFDFFLFQTDMNQTVEVLSMRIVQLENALCDAQEQQESSDAEKEELIKRIAQMQTHIDGIVFISNVKNAVSRISEVALRTHS